MEKPTRGVVGVGRLEAQYPGGAEVTGVQHFTVPVMDGAGRPQEFSHRNTHLAHGGISIGVNQQCDAPAAGVVAAPQERGDRSGIRHDM